jgi:hypothetical protein
MKKTYGQPVFEDLCALQFAMDRRSFFRIGAYAAAGMLAACGGGNQTVAASDQSGQPSTSDPLTLKVQQAMSDTAVLDASFASFSYEKRYLHTSTSVFFGPDNASLIGLFNALGGGVLRIGGNSVDRITWTPEGVGQVKAQVSRTDVNNLANFLKLCPNWKVIYGINFAGAHDSSSSPALAADEAAYVAQQLGTQLLAFEIGNEPDSYGDTRTPNLAGLTYTSFINGGTVTQGTTPGWVQFAQAITSAVSGAVFSGPSAASDSSGWAESFAVTEKGNFAWLTEHYYISNYNSAAPSIAGMLSYPDTNLVAALQNLRTAASKAGVPFRIDEANSYFSSTSPAGVSNVFASALWAIDFIFTHAQYGASGLNFHNNGAIKSYTAIGDASGAVTAVQPIYYALLFFSQIFAGGTTGRLLTTTLSENDLAVSTFAVATADGATYVVVNNKDTSNVANLTIALDSSASQATVMTLVSSGENATDQLANPGIYDDGVPITFGGQAVALDGAWSGVPQQTLKVVNQNVSVQVAPVSAALIRIQ